MVISAKQLSSDLVTSLQGEKIVTMVTIDVNTGLPKISAVSWVLASQDGTKVKIALGHKASSIENIHNNPNVVLSFIGAGSCYAVYGAAEVSGVIEKTMKLCVVTLHVHEVEDVIFYGGKVTIEPAYEKTYNPELAKKLDTEVYELLKD